MTVAPIIRKKARRYGIDPDAVIAVALGEGGLRNREGDIGDLSGGGSYGPFQLYAQGALPSRFRGRPQAADAWAWSPQGIDYALRQMAKAGAGGLTGPKAVETIIRKFERPADPDRSVSMALSRYSQSSQVGTRAGSPADYRRSSGSVPSGPDLGRMRADLLRSLISSRRSGSDRSAVIAGLSSLREAEARPPHVPKPDDSEDGGGGHASPGVTPGGVRELFYDPAGAYDEGRWVSPIGGHSDHVHVSFGTPDAALAGIRQAKRLGLSARENPYVDPVDPVHTSTSYHYSNFPGKYGGRALGRALDVSGSADAMRRYYEWVRRTYLGGRRR